MQQVNQQVSALLDKEMDRAEFLKCIGIGVMALTGVGAVLAALNGSRLPAQGYGSSSYGGVQR